MKNGGRFFHNTRALLLTSINIQHHDDLNIACMSTPQQNSNLAFILFHIQHPQRPKTWLIQ